jgi:hypothetical protein
MILVCYRTRRISLYRTHLGKAHLGRTIKVSSGAGWLLAEMGLVLSWAWMGHREEANVRERARGHTGVAEEDPPLFISGIWLQQVCVRPRSTAQHTHDAALPPLKFPLPSSAALSIVPCNTTTEQHHRAEVNIKRGSFIKSVRWPWCCT